MKNIYIGVGVLAFVVYFILSMRMNNPFEFLWHTHESNLLDNFIFTNNKGNNLKRINQILTFPQILS